MKYLVLFGVLLVAYLLWRKRSDAPARSRRDAAAATPALPQDMVSCPVCALHLPRNEAVAGSNGRLYCCPEHRASAGV